MSPELDLQPLIRSMVRALLARPAEWLTFRYLAELVQCDPDLIGGVVDARQDLFVTSRDRRLKLRQDIVEQIASNGIANWKVPELRELVAPPVQHPSVKSIPDQPGTRCYCGFLDEEILIDLKRGSLPEDALVRTCCWTRICQVRGRYFNLVDPEAWREICARRGYLHARENPRGF